MQKPTPLLLSPHLSGMQHLYLALVFMVLLLIIFSQLASQKQNRHRRDTSLDQFIVNHYKEMLFAMVKSPFKRGE